ncbi:MAG: 2-nitropropane dioxygenase [Nocardioides sp.]|nr:2-nitropropane dioxygenase [Nocardioides sp.]MCK5926903.1 nitronate monooxygenase [Nocardioides sp.]|tara:strand:+ start:633 stop:1679 length:1047 start_codon:yes stop_codon:yes gene_type:complete
MSVLPTRYTELVGIEHPIIQEGMGPFKTVALAAAVSNAGGMGTISMPGMSQEPSEGAAIMRSHIAACAELTDKPFAVNVPVGADDTGTVLPITEAYINAVIEAREADSKVGQQLKVLTTSAGFPGAFAARIKDAGLIHQHKVGSTRQAIKAEEAGADVIIASGYEMGGHTHHSPVHTFVLLPNVTAAVSVPVLLSGGARDGRTLAAALTLGASGVAMGTRFIASADNTDWHPSVPQFIVDAREGDDLVFPGVYGPARGLRNPATDRLLEIVANKEMTTDELTEWKDRALQLAQSTGDFEKGLVAAGQVSSGIQDVIDVATFVPQMAQDASDILQRLVQGLTPASAARV